MVFRREGRKEGEREEGKVQCVRRERRKMERWRIGRKRKDKYWRKGKSKRKYKV